MVPSHIPYKYRIRYLKWTSNDIGNYLGRCSRRLVQRLGTMVKSGLTIHRVFSAVLFEALV